MSNAFKTCVMIGLGYIGLPTAAIIARTGIKVLGVDINQRIVDTINAGRCPIEELGLPELVAEVVADGRLSASTKPSPGDVFIIAVPTPFEGTYKPDLSYVEAAVRSIAPILAKGNLVLVESTIPVGATEQAARWIEMLRPDLTVSRRGSAEDRVADVLVAHCPERILPGQMLRELVENDRVIGGVCHPSAVRGQAFYKTFVEGDCLITDSRTAELCKLTENAYRDVNIAFANELSVICDESGINVWELIGLANHHPRVNILQPGPGVGGHCIAVDPWFIVSALGDKARLIREARWINSGRPRQVVRQVLEKLDEAGDKVGRVACFGLSYKPNIDDTRESPAVEVVEYLAKELPLSHPGVALEVVDPFVPTLPKGLAGFSDLKKVDTEVGLTADMIVMLVDHRQFKEIPASRVAGKVLVDTRGVWSR
jgi:UDP-N-acetyl-D-mannosaminuronic acid dehydrogenase